MSGSSSNNEIKIVVPIMGPTGAGKSTFVNTLIGDNKMQVGHQLTSCTSEPTPVPVPNFRIPGLDMEHTLVVLDTPGFDDTNEGDVTILTRIAEWLKKAYRDNTYILGGVLYLHDISQKRFTGTARKNLSMFNHMCGEVALPNVVLCTTNWPTRNVDQALPEQQREGEFRGIHWKPMIEKGSEVMRFYRTRESAQEVIKKAVRHLVDDLDPENPLALEIQEELVTKKKHIPETKAAGELRYTLKEVMAMQKKIAEAELAMAAKGDADARARHAELADNVKKISNQVNQLKIPLSLKFRGSYL